MSLERRADACPDERVMLALVAGRVPAAETAVREHLDRCRACRELVAVLSRGPPG